MFYNIYKSIYKVSVLDSVKKDQEKIPKKDLLKIKETLLKLEENPRPFKCKKLQGGTNQYRVRYGNWRILYRIDDDKKNVVIYAISNRKEAYR